MSMKPVISTEWTVEEITPFALPPFGVGMGCIDMGGCLVAPGCRPPGGGGWAPPFGCGDIHFPESDPGAQA